MKAIEQAAAEQFGRDVTTIGYLYANRIITTKELTNMVNRARDNFMCTMVKGGVNDGET